jgi:hypothetical protein
VGAWFSAAFLPLMLVLSMAVPLPPVPMRRAFPRRPLSRRSPGYLLTFPAVLGTLVLSRLLAWGSRGPLGAFAVSALVLAPLAFAAGAVVPILVVSVALASTVSAAVTAAVIATRHHCAKFRGLKKACLTSHDLWTGLKNQLLSQIWTAPFGSGSKDQCKELVQ